jgi:uncharacterized protein
LNDPAQIRRALETAETIAVVGCSPNPARPSHSIALYLMENGYRVIPVNPGHREILGQPCYRSLAEIPADRRIDIVDVFRRPEFIAPVAEQAIARGVGFFFMQLGIAEPVSARRLEEAGIPVAMDRCILVEHGRHRIPPRKRNAAENQNVALSGRRSGGSET